MHDSKAAYMHSLTPEGNPKGERYHIADNGPQAPYKPPEFSEESRVEGFKKALEDVKNNRVPPVNIVPENI